MRTQNQSAWLEGLPAWDPLPSLSGKLRADVCVVGLGGSGLAAVRRLQEQGLSVVGLDAGQVAGQAAGRNGGLLLGGIAAFHHVAERQLGREVAVAWYRDTLQELERMLAETPAHTRRTGSLRIAADAHELEDCGAQLLSMRAAGLPVEEYSGPEGEGLLFPLDGTYNPVARNRQLASLALADGAHLFEHSPVTSLSGRLVETPAGRVECLAVLVAADGRLAELLPELATSVKPLRLQMLACDPIPPRYARPVYFRHGFEYWQQLADGRVLLGGFRDHGGEGEWYADPVPGGVVQERLERFLREKLRIDSPISHRWAATVGYRSELLPYFGQVRDGVWATGGYNGTGNVVGSLLGRRLADEITAAV